MTHNKLITCAIGLALILCIQLAFAAETITARVVGVTDGDTITVLTSERQQIHIRLSQIDAPEKSQDFGQASKQSLSDLVFGKDVSIEVETIDKYGRTVGKVKVGGVDANLQQINRGMAWAYTKYAYEPSFRTPFVKIVHFHAD